jgi:hypothetical protein
MTVLEIRKKSQLSKSSMIDRLVYSKEDCNLTIYFEKGSVYNYKNVPSNIVRGFAETTSVGKYFSEHIKGKYSSSRLEEVVNER